MALLFEVLFKVLLLLAPITPMLTEHLYLKMFKPYLEGLDVEATESIHLQDWPQFDENKISEDLEDQMDFTKELIEAARSLKNKNRLRLRWPNKKLIVESTEKLPDIEFTETIKKMINVKEFEVVDSFSPDEHYAQIESKYGDIYLDLSVDDSILADRVTNDLVRNIQYTRKQNEFKVGEEISLQIGTDTEYLKDFVDMNKDLITDKVSATEFDLLGEPLGKDKAEIVEDLKICPNKECSASLKKNAVKRMKNKPDAKCPYCGEELDPEEVKEITFSFQRKS
jgi:valyl-tRNA synthetase